MLPKRGPRAASGRRGRPRRCRRPCRSARLDRALGGLESSRRRHSLRTPGEPKGSSSAIRPADRGLEAAGAEHPACDVMTGDVEHLIEQIQRVREHSTGASAKYPTIVPAATYATRRTGEPAATSTRRRWPEEPPRRAAVAMTPAVAPVAGPPLRACEHDRDIEGLGDADAGVRKREKQRRRPRHSRRRLRTATAAGATRAGTTAGRQTDTGLTVTGKWNYFKTRTNLRKRPKMRRMHEDERGADVELESVAAFRTQLRRFLRRTDVVTSAGRYDPATLRPAPDAQVRRP